MEKCYEYLGCKQIDCPMFERKDNKNCWEVENTLCNHHGIELSKKMLDGKKEEACAYAGCIYYKASTDRSNVNPHVA